MSYHTTRRTRLQTQLTAVQAALTKLYETQLEFAGYENHSYSFDSGEGSQRTTRFTPTEINKQISELEAKEARLCNELSGVGIVTIRLRRKS